MKDFLTWFKAVWYREIQFQYYDTKDGVTLIRRDSESIWRPSHPVGMVRTWQEVEL